MAKQVIYRKYRPQKFGDIIGQEQIVKVLQKTVELDQPSHAYLFTGSRGTGKTTTARVFAKELNQIAADEQELMDIIEIDAASNRGINEIRELREKVNFSPARYKYKVYIIDEAHMLTKEAFNAFLKTLEEPPEHAVFIFATTEVHKMPQTILSRVVRFDFRLANTKQLSEKLETILTAENIKYTSDALERLIQLARGSYRDAESLLEKVMKLTKNSEGFKLTSEAVEQVLGLVPIQTLNSLVEKLIADTEVNASNLLTLLDKIFEAGTSSEQLLDGMANLILEKIQQGSNKQSNLIKLASTIQHLQVNLSKYSAPQVAISIAFLEFSDENDNDHPREPIAEKVKVVAEQVGSQSSENSKNATAKAKSDSKVAHKAKNSKAKAQTSNIDLLKQVKERLDIEDFRLAGIFSAAELIVNNDVVEIAVPYSFHKKRLEDIQGKRILTKVLSEVLAKEDIKFEITLKKKESKKNVSQHEEGKSDIVEEVFGDII